MMQVANAEHVEYIITTCFEQHERVQLGHAMTQTVNVC